MKAWDDARAWYGGLAPRERRIVTAGGIVLLLIILWLAIVSPWLNAKTALAARVEADAQTLAWMQQAAPRLKQLERAAPHAAATVNRSLFAVVEQTAQSSPIGANIKQFQPRGDKSVQVHLEAAPFDALIEWLGQLQAQSGVAISALNVQRADAPGTVNADVTFERAQ
ncbi:MAG TPA: type II secretion system protein M [Gammaproteobacteria bacterium]|jgi:general secretion pathway protein M|nr:type II secretion system protein M [Gammaproteobacteria bacterium]